MTRAFIINLELDPSADPNVIAQEIFDAISYDFPETISVKPWSEHDAIAAGPNPIEGSMFLGQTPQ